jgi:hypothetical protein
VVMNMDYYCVSADPHNKETFAAWGKIWSKESDGYALWPGGSCVTAGLLPCLCENKHCVHSAEFDSCGRTWSSEDCLASLARNTAFLRDHGLRVLLPHSQE